MMFPSCIEIFYLIMVLNGISVITELLSAATESLALIFNPTYYWSTKVGFRTT